MRRQSRIDALLPLGRKVERRLLGIAGLYLLASWGFVRSADAQAAQAYQMIVNQNSAASGVSRELLSDIFLKKATRWDTGEVAVPVDQRASSVVRKAFSAGVLKRSVAAVRNYWTQRIFAGRELPPPELESDETVVRFVASHPGAVGYVTAGATLGATKRLEVR